MSDHWGVCVCAVPERPLELAKNGTSQPVLMGTVLMSCCAPEKSLMLMPDNALHGCY